MITTSTPSTTGADARDARVPAPRRPRAHPPGRRADPVEQPPAPTARLVGIDAAAGVALLGLIAVDALLTVDAQGRPTPVFSLVAGRSAAALAVLAGVGVALLTGRRRVRLGRPARETSAALAVRALVVGAIGLALGYSDPEIATVILPSFAALLLLAVPLVLLPTPVLGVLATAAVAGLPYLSQVLRASRPVAVPTTHSFVDLMAEPGRVLSEIALTGGHPALTFAAYLCAGLAMGRLRLTSAKVAAALLVAGAVAAAGAVALSGWLLGAGGGLARLEAAGTGRADLAVADVLAFGGDGVAPTTSPWWLAVRAPHTGTPLDLLHNMSTTVALLATLLLLGHVTVPVLRRAIAVLLVPLAAVGSLALTLYVAHIVFMNSPFDAFDPLPGYLVQAATALLVALGWRQAVGRGPLEAVVRLAATAAGRAAGGTRRPRQEAGAAGGAVSA